MQPSNRVAIITGASRGLGAVIARVLARRGYDLVVGARNRDPLEEAAASFARWGSRVAAVDGDVADAAARARLVSAARELGGLDVLVNNASELGAIGPLIDFDVPRLGRMGAYPGWGPYGASKAALELLTRTLATELRGRGVSAAIVDPGNMRTRMHQEAFPLEDISDRPQPEVTEPFWNWLFDQTPAEISGERFAAQAEDARWLQRV
ncbi:MAG: short-chain dehydrogenase [Acidobacteria bacterium]|nr:MAG: short-chain dehydrogenase [Acidobacteriota bacterium]